MESLELLISFYNTYIDTVIFVLVLAGGEFAKLYMKEINLNTRAKTLIASFLFALLYLLFQFASGEFDRTFLAKYFLTFAIAVVSYDYVIKAFVSKVKNFANGAK
jgi:hypothetical protein